MGPCKKFYNIHPGESFEELRNRRGVSLEELLEQINKVKTTATDGVTSTKDLTFDNLSEDDRVAQNKMKKLRGALNKLAPDNFYVQLLDMQDTLPVENIHLMKIFVRELVQKTTSDCYYTSLYAHLCRALSSIELVEVPLEDDNILTFGDLLLDECYRYFCYNRSSWNWFYINEPKPEDLIVLEAADFRKRKDLAGLVKFLGELYKAGMINIKEIYEYIKKLEQETNEKNIEGLCVLLSTVGRELESEVFQSESAGDWVATWERIVTLSKKEANLPLRQRFMLMDLLDLMNNGWVARRPPTVPLSHIEILLDFQEKDIENGNSKKMKPEKRGMMQTNEDTLISDTIIANEPIVVKTEQEVMEFLKSDDDIYNSISKWEVDNFEGRKTWFVYSVMRAILRVSIDGNVLNEARFKEQMELLKNYISSRQAEVACMYAVQYVAVVELSNPKGLLENITRLLHKTGAVSYIGLLDWRENWSGHKMLEVRGKSAAHISLATLFLKLFWDSVRPNYKPVVQELNSFDLEHFVSSPKLPPEISKRTKMEEERDKSELLKNAKTEDEDDPDITLYNSFDDTESLKNLKA